MGTATHDAGAEIDLLVYIERNEPVPHGHAYRVPIDGEKVRIDTATPTGEQVLAKVETPLCLRTDRRVRPSPEPGDRTQ